MPVLKGIAVQLQDHNAHPIVSFPDPAEQQAEPYTTSSRLIHYKPGEPFRIVLYSPTPDPAGLPSQCSVLEIQIFDKNKLIWGPKTLSRGENAQNLDVKITKDLWWPVATTTSTTDDSMSSSADTHPEETVVVQLTPCRLVRQVTQEIHDINDERGKRVQTTTTATTNHIPETIPNTILTWKFKLLQPQTTTSPQFSPNSSLSSFINGQSQDLPTTTTRKQKLMQRPLKAHGDLTPSHPHICAPEHMYCCGQQLRGADPEAMGGEMLHTGVIVCDNDFCQNPTRHKACVGMEVWEEPETLWICPDCREKDQRQMEIREGGLSQDEIGVLEGWMDFRC